MSEKLTPKTVATTPPRPMTRRQLSKHQREVRRQRIAITTVGVLILIALLVPLFGYWREVIAKGDQPIAIVHGKSLSTEQYARYLAYQQAMLQREVGKIVETLSKNPAPTPAPIAQTTPTAQTPGPTPTTDPATIESQSAQLAIQLLQQRSSNLSAEAVDNLIDSEILHEEAQKRGLTITDEELRNALQREMSDYSLGGYRMSEISSSFAAPIGYEQAQNDLKTILSGGKLLSEDEHRRYVLEADILKTKMENILSKDIPTSAEQIRARHILVDTEEQAKAAIARIQAGEDFAKVAQDLSKDTSSKDKGGELGWFARGRMIADFENAAFSLEVGKVSDPIKTTNGYHIIQVEEKDANRPLDEDVLRQQRNKAYTDWLMTQTTSDPNAVQRFDTTDKIQWAEKFALDLLTIAQTATATK